MISIIPSALAAIEAHAASAYPEECCGILLAEVPAAPGGESAVRIVEAIPAQNLAPSNRRTRFTLDPRAYIHADRLAREKGLAVVGCYHSHPDHPALPSATDVSLAWDDFLYLILPTTSAATAPPRVWRYRNNAPEEIALTTERA